MLRSETRRPSSGVRIYGARSNVSRRSMSADCSISRNSWPTRDITHCPTSIEKCEKISNFHDAQRAGLAAIGKLELSEESKPAQSYPLGEQFSSYKRCLRELEDSARKRRVQLNDYVQNRLRDPSERCSCRFECLSVANGEGHLLIPGALESSETDWLRTGVRSDRSTETSSLLSESCCFARPNRRDSRNKSSPSSESVGVVVSPESSISSRREPRQQRVNPCEKHGTLFIDENNLGERGATGSAGATSSCCSDCCRLGSHSYGARVNCACATNADSPTSSAGFQVSQPSERRQPTTTTIDELTADELAVYELLADYDDYRDDRLLELESVLQSDADSAEDCESRGQLAHHSGKPAGRADPHDGGSHCEWPDFQLDCSLTNESPLSVSLLLEDPQQLRAGRHLDCISSAGWSSPGGRADRQRALVARRTSGGPEGETIVCTGSPGNSSRRGSASGVSSSGRARARGTVSPSARTDEQLRPDQRTNELPARRQLAAPHSLDKVGLPARKMGLSNAKNSNREQPQASESSSSENNSIDALGGDGGAQLDPDHKREKAIKSASRSADSHNDKRADLGDSDEQLQHHQENCHCLPLSDETEQQETGGGATACVSQGSNMRALRNVAKVSVPSLAALQYLPAQLDRRKPPASKTTGDADEKTMASAKPGPMSAASLASISESKENVQHELSCWKHRLCLCNCISKSSPPTGLRAVEQTKVATTKKIQTRFHRSKSPLDAVDVEPASERTSRAELPSLSGIEAQLSQHKSPKCVKKVEAAPLQGQVDSGEKEERADDDSARRKAATEPQPTSPTSPSRPNKKPQRSYKNFLSPSRLFDSQPRAPSGSSSDFHENSEGESSLRVDSRNSDEHQSGSSLISRSLSRLSGRRPKNQIWPPKGRLEASTRQSVGSGGDVSPTINVASAPRRRQRGSLDTPDSFESLEDSKLTNELSSSSSSRQHSSNYVSSAPEIVLSKVEYLNTRNQHTSDNCNCGVDSIKSCDMGGGYSSTSGGKHNRRPDVQPHYLNGRIQPPLSLSASQTNFTNYNRTSPDSQAEGPFSLPGSPQAQRRHNNRSRSPRLSQSPVPFRSPAIESTKIEDGLRVCSIEHFEKHIDNIKVNQVEAQKHLFTAWINHFCPNLIRNDLIEELRDGIKLIGLLATLGHDTRLLAHYEQLNREQQFSTNRLLNTTSSRFKHLSNVGFAIDYLRTELGMKLINLNPMDIVSGKSNVILGLCWNIILRFQLEQNFFKYSDTASNYSSDNSASLANSFTSRLSSDTSSLNNANEDGSRKHIPRSTSSSPSLIEEVTPRDLIQARNKLLEYVNRRFRLKLTNLTSSLLDGDVLFLIIKHLLLKNQATSDEELERLRNNLLEGRMWAGMDDDAKLDVCFELANKYLNVPKLFSASDLRQSIVESSPKLSLVYLSMLLNSSSRRCSEARIRELEQSEQNLTETNPTTAGERDTPTERPIKQKFAPQNRKKNRKASIPKKVSKVDENKDKEVEPARAQSYIRLLWNKVVRASKVSLSFNIILLICLAGICVVPLINKNACCELSQESISQDKFTVVQRPT